MHGQNVPALLEMEFDMIIPSHGPTMKGGAKEDLKKGWGQAKKSDMWKSPWRNTIRACNFILFM